ncbi:hypothetical protein TWF106_007129 [Orbilia oligospora]|uniref:Uncharacterized protein n=1 Tax=Orbilia oligospora TaxID=2813651 RepID=A0A6G1M3D6_ORBOL|nr:hypothetical protein TWF679_008191 [Orbilia oligospora]KAF3219288.1 hypothetical protein TWF106_007129 [Orbilia oligospora]KAF3244062.1 hypothetical protein TWF192_007868 [Orbilia oligospora]
MAGSQNGGKEEEEKDSKEATKDYDPNGPTKTMGESYKEIEKLDILGSAKSLKSALSWIKQLQSRNEELTSEKYELEKEMVDLMKEIDESPEIVNSRTMAELCFGLREAHKLINEMRDEYTKLEETSKAKKEEADNERKDVATELETLRQKRNARKKGKSAEAPAPDTPGGN